MHPAIIPAYPAVSGSGTALKDKGERLRWLIKA